MPAEVLVWWTQHQIEDKEREAEEAAERKTHEKKAKALKKLSKEERQLLGI